MVVVVGVVIVVVMIVILVFVLVNVVDVYGVIVYFGNGLWG